MRLLRQNLYSWNSWIDRRIEKSRERQAKMRDRNLEYRLSPETPDEKRISKELRKRISESGILILDAKSEKMSAGYSPSKSYIPEEKFGKFGLNKDLIPEGVPLIMASPNAKPHLLAHELGHAHNDFWKKHVVDGSKKHIQDRPLTLLLEETRANARAWKTLKDLKPSEKTWEDSKVGIKNCEKHYLEKFYQDILKKLKTEEKRREGLG